MELAPPRGTQDLLPDRADAMLGLYDEAHSIARTYGYRYVETPTFEQTELFARTSGETSDVVTKEMYTFEDKGGRSVTLRPESTAGVVRAYLTHAQSLPTPFKGYYVASEFRHGRPQAGRMREFRQFGIEVIGTAAAGADVEVIVMGERFLQARGLSSLTLHLNSIGDDACRPAYRERLVSYLAPFRDDLDRDCRTRLEKNPLRVFDCKVDGGKDFVLAAPTIADHLCDACAAHFAEVRAGLDAAGVAYVHDPRLVRGLDYYTRTAFEWISDVLAANKAGTVNAGGRYDGLAEALGGPATPGVGFAMGLDRVLLAMEGEDVPVPPPRTPTCFVVAIGDEAREAGGSLLGELRSEGIAAVDPLESRPLKAQLKMADRVGAEFALIVGERELADGVCTLRRLADGVQKTVPRADVVRWLTRLDGWTDGAR
ncbi:MAG TPA: histidine--tRNA ligase [Actinomycetota bacterium]|nr:histidine--tRNA ligase [Actinomycetota bacterium]